MLQEGVYTMKEELEERQQVALQIQKEQVSEQFILQIESNRFEHEKLYANMIEERDALAESHGAINEEQQERAQLQQQAGDERLEVTFSRALEAEKLLQVC